MAGEGFSLAEIRLWCFVGFAITNAAFQIDPAHRHLHSWFDAVASRPAPLNTLSLAYGRT